ncbi:MAG: hypothetical protein AAF481_17460 [Acidobacteriota bacterium]
MPIQLASLREGQVEAMYEILDLLALLEDESPRYLNQVPFDEIQARGALSEAVVTYSDVERFLDSTESALFSRTRVILLNDRGKELGAVGLSSDEGKDQFKYLAERGGDDLIEALRIAERFADHNGVTFEARLLVIQDLILQVLVLYPVTDGVQVHVLPLAPTFGFLSADGPPLPKEEFLSQLRVAWERSRSLLPLEPA